jgi:hypothetical protein
MPARGACFRWYRWSAPRVRPFKWTPRESRIRVRVVAVDADGIEKVIIGGIGASAAGENQYEADVPLDSRGKNHRDRDRGGGQRRPGIAALPRSGTTRSRSASGYARSGVPAIVRARLRGGGRRGSDPGALDALRCRRHPQRQPGRLQRRGDRRWILREGGAHLRRNQSHPVSRRGFNRKCRRYRRARAATSSSAGHGFVFGSFRGRGPCLPRSPERAGFRRGRPICDRWCRPRFELARGARVPAGRFLDVPEGQGMDRGGERVRSRPSPGGWWPPRWCCPIRAGPRCAPDRIGFARRAEHLGPRCATPWTASLPIRPRSSGPSPCASNHRVRCASGLRPQIRAWPRVGGRIQGGPRSWMSRWAARIPSS